MQGPVCWPVSDACVPCDDPDQDGFGRGDRCEGLDCAEHDPRTHPGAEDLCDGVDNDCDGEVDEAFLASACGLGRCRRTTECVSGEVTDCTPGQAARLDQSCDGIDDDCDGREDEDFTPRTCGVGACQTESVCEGGLELNCAAAPPAGPDDNCDGVDQDCDGLSDESYQEKTCGVGLCAARSSCIDGQERACSPLEPGPVDLDCDGLDDDCDGMVDEGFVGQTCGIGACQNAERCVEGVVVACAPGEPIGADNSCNGFDEDCDGRQDEAYVAVLCGFGECQAQSTCENGREAACTPSEPAAPLDTTCNGLDEDCDGRLDEDYQPEVCGIGACSARSSCRGGVEFACVPSEPIADDRSCDGVDNDCDGLMDEGFEAEQCGVGACQARSSCADGLLRPCEARDPLAADDASCDGVDDDCDGQTDEDYALETCGLGACQNQSACVAGLELGCEPKSQRTANDLLCDGIDEDCDGEVDEGCRQLNNQLRFDTVVADADMTQVNVSYRQIPSPPNGGPMPRLLDVEFELRRDNVQVVQAFELNIDPRLSALDKRLESFQEMDGSVRVLIDGVDDRPIEAGRLFTVVFTDLPAGTYHLHWRTDRTHFAPVESDEILTTLDEFFDVSACDVRGPDDNCDGQDDDCDGSTDEGYQPEQCGVGSCLNLSECEDGRLIECAPGTPNGIDANCDGLDNDCDGQTDEDFTATVCGHGPCAAPSQCRDGEERCLPRFEAAENDDSSCDGIDSDCNGAIDEDYAVVRCGQGACERQSSCTDGVEAACEAGVAQGVDESCDGVDDDCDGAIDENYIAGHCGLGPCRTQSTCEGGVESCRPHDPINDDDNSCDGVDDDCDGTTDEGYIAQLCGVGVCARPQTCVDGALSACEAAEPATALDSTCDGQDDDCDGAVDEDYLAEACGEGQCAGQTRCSSGSAACVPDLAPQATDQSCDGVDDDCDGTADEDYQATECGLGACIASSRCIEGVEQACVPAEAGPEDAGCDGVDTDCDGAIDEDYQVTECGFGICASASLCQDGIETLCQPRAADADDQICDGLDTDCDGRVDEHYQAEPCGVGACRALSRCVDGQSLNCEPGPPIGFTDDSCDLVDDDCDGEIDEDCDTVANLLTLTQSAQQQDEAVFRIDFSQTGVLESRAALRPNLATVELELGDGYTIDGPDSVTLGPAAATHTPTIDISDDGRTIVIFLLNFAGTPIETGQLLTVRLDVQPLGARTLRFNPAGTFFAPQESNDALRLVSP